MSSTSLEKTVDFNISDMTELVEYLEGSISRQQNTETDEYKSIEMLISTYRSIIDESSFYDEIKYTQSS